MGASTLGCGVRTLEFLGQPCSKAPGAPSWGDGDAGRCCGVWSYLEGVPWVVPTDVCTVPGPPGARETEIMGALGGFLAITVGACVCALTHMYACVCTCVHVYVWVCECVCTCVHVRARVWGIENPPLSAK